MMARAWLGCAFLALALAACSSAAPGTSAQKSGTTSSQPATADSGPPCTKAAVTQGADRGNRGAVVTAFACAGAFAYAFVEVPTGGPDRTEVALTDLFKAAGPSWQSVERATYCPNHSVPASIYHAACRTGRTTG
jgi:hypothetical protein